MFCRYYNNYDECAEDNLATFAVAPSRERGLKSFLPRRKVSGAVPAACRDTLARFE